MSIETSIYNFDYKIFKLKGPILILGASGFIGSYLFKLLLANRSDIFGTASKIPSWRLENISDEHILTGDLLVDENLNYVLSKIKPQTIFNCLSFGAYSFEVNPELIYLTNFNLTSKILSLISKMNISSYIHAGSSSEYGLNSTAPKENDIKKPNSHYAVSKLSTSYLINYFGKINQIPCANLRLYSVYGPFEDSSRLISTVIQKGELGSYPNFVDPEISRDFIYVEDACEAFIDVANNLLPKHYGESFNVGTGTCTKIKEIAALSKKIFNIKTSPTFCMKKKDWDLDSNWQSDSTKIRTELNWSHKHSLENGFIKTVDWYRSLHNKQAYIALTKKFGQPCNIFSITAVIACYKDEKAIPILYERLSSVLKKINVDYEIIFVNDASPDKTESVIQELSMKDHNVIGITHSVNFGSQAAFKSGMEISTKNACVLLDGDLQDPPELIEDFFNKWKEGYEIVYGIRKKREAPLHMLFFYKLFYRLFNAFSYVKIPLDAGDFSLMDKKVVRSILSFPERDIFLRGIRAYVGFKQIGVNYLRPERMFGRTTNNFFKNIEWAKKGILSFSHLPLNLLTAFSFIFFIVVFTFSVLDILLVLVFPDIAPKGVTTIMLITLFLGAIILIALSLLGEYLAKIFIEVKKRPSFIRKSIIRNGIIKKTES